MTALNFTEKRQLEDFLGMSGGYVLDFTNRTFEEFFQTGFGVDIYSDQYSGNGNSKAKRLRAFWDTESGENVGKLLAGLLEYWATFNIDDADEKKKSAYRKCQKIAARLTEDDATVSSSKDMSAFYTDHFSGVELSKLNFLDAHLCSVLQKRIGEAEKCLAADAPIAAIILAGSVLEGVLFGYASSNPAVFNKSKTCPKTKGGQPKKLREWSLSDLITVSLDVGVLKKDTAEFAVSLRNFRNYIHPREQIAQNFNPDERTALICMMALANAIADLNKNQS